DSGDSRDGTGYRKGVDVSPVCARRGLAIALLFLLLVSARALAGDVATGGRAEPQKRPAALVPLYVGFSALQVLDAHSTLVATSSGGVEGNPLMRGAAANPAAMLAVKAGVSAGVVAISERLWRHNRTAAVLTMVCLNSAYAII